MELHLKACRLTGWVREHRFAPPRRWRFDFAWPDRKLAVEVDGGVWTRGRHTRGAGVERDNEKFARAAIDGWRVVRVTPGQIRSGQAIRWIEAALGLPLGRYHLTQSYDFCNIVSGGSDTCRDTKSPRD